MGLGPVDSTGNAKPLIKKVNDYVGSSSSYPFFKCEKPIFNKTSDGKPDGFTVECQGKNSSLFKKMSMTTQYTNDSMLCKKTMVFLDSCGIEKKLKESIYPACLKNK